MKHFLKMIEVANRTGIMVDKGGYCASVPEAIDSFNAWVSECQPFVFSRNNDVPTEIDDDFNQWQEIDAPFAVFSIEMENGSICVPREDDEIQVYVDCIMACEVKPRDFCYLTLIRQNGEYKVVWSKWWDKITESYISRINRERTGTESVRHRLRLGRGQTKKIHTIRTVIHVRPKKLASGQTSEGREINWTHAWMVRGHWRKFDGLGKDRSGAYSVRGFTWVSEYVKGDKSKSVVPKLRVVDSTSNNLA